MTKQQNEHHVNPKTEAAKALSVAIQQEIAAGRVREIKTDKELDEWLSEPDEKKD